MHLATMRVGACHATVGPVSGTLQAAAELGLDLCVSFLRGTEKFVPKLRTIVIRLGGMKPLAEQIGIAPQPWPDPSTELTAARLAFTSGTTGTPRGLMWDFDRIRQRVDQAAQNANISSATSLHVALGLLTTAGFRYPLATWEAGGCLLRHGDPKEVREPKRDTGLDSNLMVASPVNLRNHLTRLGGVWQGREQRTVLVLGGRLPIATRDEALARACSRLEVNYGSTETGGVSSGDAAVLDRHAGAVGFPGEGVDVEIVGGDGKPLPPGREGVLRIRTPGMCVEYEGGRKPSDPAFGFRKGWFYPGDLAIHYEDGLLAISGRTLDVVNIAGMKLSTTDVESQALRLPSVKEVCALPIRLDQGDMLAVVVVLANEVDPATLRNEVGRLLPVNCPYCVVTSAALPRNAMGKVKRRELMARVTAVVQRKADDEGATADRADGH
jgi:acyl-coenzyme A synthetase/AMP-(fatty) acid ligase